MNAKNSTTNPKPKTKTRQFKAPRYKSFRMHKRIKTQKATLSPVGKLIRKAYRQIRLQRWTLFWITIIYGILVLFFVRGLSGGLSVRELRENLDLAFTGQTGPWASSAAIFGVLLGSASATNGDLASLYQTIVLVIASLAYIWVFRQAQANTEARVGVREAFYKGCAPVIPFILVLFVIGLQLLPIALANLFYSFVIGGGFAVTLPEQVIWHLLIGLLMLLSLYMISSSIFALYIVTLPNTKPMQALRIARELVRHRRWTVMRKIILLPVVLVLFLALITLPSLVYIPSFAEWIFFIGTILLLPAIHAYVYTLYRELI